MKKMSKAFGAVAVSAALAMGCAVPAFADVPDPSITGDPSGSGMSEGDNTSPIHTDVLAYISDQPITPSTDQISAAVPMAIYIVIDGSDTTEHPITAPTNYYIKNTGDNVLNVKNVKAAAAGAWNLKGKADAFASGTDQLKMNFASGVSTFDLGQASVAAGYDLNMQIPANAPATFAIDGTSQVAAKKAENTTGEKVVTLTYTLEKVAATPSV